MLYAICAHMVEFNVSELVRLLSTLREVEADLTEGRFTIAPHHTQPCVGTLKRIQEASAALELRTVAPHIERIAKALVSPSGLSTQAFGSMLGELRRRVEDELDSACFFFVPPNRSMYRSSLSAMWTGVSTRFPDSTHDIDEAGLCFASGAYTACVFHVMRVLEYALQEIGKMLGMTDQRPNWEPIIKRIDAELRADYKDRCFKGQYEVLSEVAAHMRSIKIAWRNRVMHVDRTYDEATALNIMTATGFFLEFLAKHVHNEVVEARHA